MRGPSRRWLKPRRESRSVWRSVPLLPPFVLLMLSKIGFRAQHSSEGPHSAIFTAFLGNECSPIWCLLCLSALAPLIDWISDTQQRCTGLQSLMTSLDHASAPVYWLCCFVECCRSEIPGLYVDPDLPHFQHLVTLFSLVCQSGNFGSQPVP
jgi:hypothetical protein